ncbi:myosin light chain kinase, smooth muscle [Drosophila eugracilis]|uniref:myosin light chain kinase, smooth muscle n=1 Tax=Drosophila eugracilis TaxID=29029 RepID=UPI0007E7ECCA|nr:myosin light chain kinase, smooth muscle [Drosophila eugracilis]XP_017066624.1 myosin light chain kinase, smooth muscle [Drosophila eugracilis]
MIYIDDSEPEGVLEPAFPMRDVTINRNVDAHKLYDVLGEVGRGKFGTVYKCKDKTNGLQLAAKFVPIPKREDKRNVEREVEIMNSLQHHLIIQLYAAYEYQKMMCVVLELIEGGELFDRVVDDEFVLTERVCRVFIRQVCEAMAFIHGNGIVHLDLKPENILVLTQKGNRIKIIDFGLARKFDPDKRLRVLFGTPEFVAPEVVNFDCISYGTDMWSVGVICYVLISGLSPFMGENDIETMSNVTIAKYDFEDECFNGISPECLDFIAKLLAKDLSTRMTAAECMKHKWLQQRPATAATATPITKSPTVASKSRLKSVSPVTAPSESSEDSTETIEDEEDEEVEVEQSKQEDSKQDEELAKLCSAAELEDKELDATKDNLKNFIVRWETHPNSPYVFDVEGNVIAPLSETSYPHPRRTQDSLSSSRVCSPSPCESIATMTDDEQGEDDNLHEEEEARSVDNESPHSVATPINESKEKLFPTVTTSSPATPTPQHLFNENFDEFSGSQSTAQQQRSMKSYLHTFDRRNSDTTYLLGRRSSGERVNLADEIRKLSDHLLMLAEINTKLGDANNNNGSSSSGAAPNPPAPAAPSISVAPSGSTSTKTSEISQEGNRWTSKTTSSSSWNRPTAKGGLLSQASSSSQSQSSYDDGQGKTKISSLSVRLQQSIEETPKLSNGNSSTSKSLLQSQRKSTVHTMSSSNAKSITSQHVQKTSTTSSKVFSSSTSSSTSTSSSNQVTSSTSNQLPYSVSNPISTSASSESASSRRAKFRINQMSRDVPVGLPDTHQTVNLEEAANTTKDCLLHLLEKYNETRIRNPVGRHQSISVDWHVSDNLEYRSMSSINAFFQRHNHNGGGHNVRHIQAQLEEKAAGK